MKKILFGSLISLNFFGLLAHASDGKSAYSLFNRVPEAELRPLSTDRPDVTESPYTVDAGWYQIELDVAVSRFDKNEQLSTSYLQSNIKVGLNHYMDLQFIVDPFDYSPNGQQVRNNSQMRLKINLFGNDSGDVAAALLPFVTFTDGKPETTNKKMGAGLAIPLFFALPEDWSLGAMVQWTWGYDESLDGYQLNYLTSFSLSREIKEKLSGFIEYAANSDVDKSSPGAHQIGLGLVYLQTPSQQWDIGVFTGITDANQDYVPFLGYTARF
jgi:hypothetical protein